MRTACLVILLMASAVLAGGDRIIMVYDLAIEGRIHQEAKDFIILMVHN